MRNIYSVHALFVTASLLCTLAPSILLAQDKILPGDTTGAITANQSLDFSFDLEKDEGATITVKFNTGLSSSCSSGHNLTLQDSDGIGVSSDFDVTINSATDGFEVLHVHTKAEKSGTHKVNFVRSDRSANGEECMSQGFPYTLTYKKFQGALAPTQQTEAFGPAAYNDMLEYLDTHQYFFSVKRKRNIEASLSAITGLSSGCASDVVMELQDSSGMVLDDARAFSVGSTQGSSPLQIAHTTAKRGNYKLLVKRLLGERDNYSCNETEYEYTLALDIPEVKICTEKDIKRSCRKKAKRRCTRRDASNMKRCMRPIRKRCRARGIC